MHDHGVTGLMICNGATLVFVHDAALLLHATRQIFLYRFLEILYGNRLVSTAYCQDGSLVYDIC